ncbi:KR domain-containing protein [Stachybotrys elegans]|uniref:KR domain-containing protein n=1 Tax=Stachybotrys elegans TaxID=80388 RepID=A0A8K0SHM0_9HYPO|nr:KR domain-containing protein [Stachybotrys elegans]
MSKFLARSGLLILVHSGDAPLAEIQSSLASAGLKLQASFSSVYLCTVSREDTRLQPRVVDLSKGSEECSNLINSLQSLGWHGTTNNLADVADLTDGAPLLLIDDPEAPLLATISESDFGMLQKIVKSHGSLLWVTSGSQMSVSSPSNALVHGFARTLRAEDPTLTFKTLDLSTYIDLRSAKAVMAVVHTLVDTHSGAFHGAEHEYCERGGVLHVSRVSLNEELLSVDEELRNGATPVDQSLRNNSRLVRMYCEKMGASGSLQFNEVEHGQDTPLGHDEVEVDIMAAGLNYKDVATCMGIVQEDEHKLGLEGAGVIRQVGSGVAKYSVGDRVLIHGKGCFANRIRVPPEFVFLLPPSVSFEEAATMSIVYFTAVYGLMELAQIKKGQSVLIHSATDGVGLASIHLCKHLGATIYVTVGNEEKRKFLQEEHGIPADHIFSSRNSDFATGIRNVTGGRGVDCGMNSLTGALLDESWRLLADKGTFLEIGKKDIVDRNSLAMEPFDRNCTYRGIDISKPVILEDHALIERILQTIRSLLVDGHIQPISPRKTFSFAQIPDAIRYMRPGVHIGKIVLSHGAEGDTQVPIRPEPLAMRLDKSCTYLIVGGLKGLCGSLAIYLARCGAKHLTIVSRSGADDERSQQVIRSLKALGTSTTITRADISHQDDAFRLFGESRLPIDGVIQGAMVLRDKTFEAMSFQEYHEALSCKLQGTWNLHRAEQRAARKLTFFTLLSSISGVIGTASQANYAAGNAFQDAFAAWRRANGMAAHAVDLGIIEDVGYMSEHADELLPEAIKLVNAQFVRVLGLPADSEETKSLSSYGVDSLAAVDLRNWLKMNLQVELTTLDILNASSLRAMCEKVVGRLITAKASY